MHLIVTLYKRKIRSNINIVTAFYITKEAHGAYLLVNEIKRMRKYMFVLAGLGLLLSPLAAKAAVTASAASLLTTNMSAKASSTPVGLFSLTLGQTAGETLSSVKVTVNAVGASTVASADLAQIAVYKDNGNGVFDPSTDLVAGTQGVVNIGTPTTVVTGSNNAIDGGKFFVSISTSSTWSSVVSPVDGISVTLPTDAVTTSLNSPTLSSLTTANIIADTTGPVLSSVIAQNTGGSVSKEAGDTLVFTFNEATAKPVITSSNITSLFALSNSHSFLDGAGNIGVTSWSADGKVLTLTLTAGTNIPSVSVGDTVTTQGALVQDAVGNNASGSVAVTGNFDGTTTTTVTPCTNGLVNGQFYYQIGKGGAFFKADNCALVTSSLKEVRKEKGRKAHGLKKLKNFLKNDRWEQNGGHDNGKHNGRGGDRD